ncbi:MAG: Bacteriocin-protection, YdeI or OmpD-Associated, partial [Acidobacteria bacterium]|nr:Bacteriocin-protection, YdeI or OmpD-Associated [Acidobacteriota bacterium]
ELSYTHQREHVEAIEQAKAPETRARRMARTVEDVRARAPKKR